MKNKIIFLLAFILFSIKGFSQKNEFTKNTKSTLIYPSGVEGWIKFNPENKFTEKNIFTSAKKEFGLNDKYTMQLVKSKMDEYGYGHYKFQEFYKGIKVLGGEYLIHTKDGKVNTGNGYIHTPTTISENKVLNEKTALNKILATINEAETDWKNERKITTAKKKNQNVNFYPKASMVFLTSEDYKTMNLCYEFFIATQQNGKHGYYYVNAKNGVIEKFLTASYTCDGTSTNTTFYGVKPIWTHDVGLVTTSFDLDDNCQSSNYTVYDYGTGLNPVFNTGSSNNLWGSTDRLRSGSTSLYAIKASYNWFKNVFGRNGHDNSDANLEIYYNYNFGTSSNPFYNNAGYQYYPIGDDEVLFGLGQTANIIDDYNTLDILGHEFTHGVTAYEANLVYAGQSGALNESFSDIFGMWIDAKELNRLNWLHGSDRIVNGIPATSRNFILPNNTGYADRIFGRLWRNTNGCIPNNDYLDPNYNDACGVHFNSSVQNRMFYLLTTGGSGWTNDSTSNAGSNVGANAFQWNIGGIGLDKSIRIAYKVLCDYLGSNSNYYDSRNAWVRAAIDIYGECSYEAIQTGKAWNAVGIGPSFNAPDYYAACGQIAATNPYFVSKPGTVIVSNNCNTFISTSGIQATYLSAKKIVLKPGVSAYGFHAQNGSKLYVGITDCWYATY